MAGGRFKVIRDEATGRTKMFNDIMVQVQRDTIRLVAEKIREEGYKGVAFDIERMADEL